MHYQLHTVTSTKPLMIRSKNNCFQQRLYAVMHRPWNNTDHLIRYTVSRKSSSVWLIHMRATNTTNDWNYKTATFPRYKIWNCLWRRRNKTRQLVVTVSEHHCNSFTRCARKKTEKRKTNYGDPITYCFQQGKILLKILCIAKRCMPCNL